ncbi:hypothetical protein HNY73_006852 [Argiope bruennichi]|uniref:Uncharacterized protein n=1 Tax=Argiope bruennichi TaxID=94029 RepID=A0A8T0FEM5_ARGBR|nr:hypothetical protein HNY73_006852 [Argiope bruennichi]
MVDYIVTSLSPLTSSPHLLFIDAMLDYTSLSTYTSSTPTLLVRVMLDYTAISLSPFTQTPHLLSYYLPLSTYTISTPTLLVSAMLDYTSLSTYTSSTPTVLVRAILDYTAIFLSPHTPTPHLLSYTISDYTLTSLLPSPLSTYTISTPTLLVSAMLDYTSLSTYTSSTPTVLVRAILDYTAISLSPLTPTPHLLSYARLLFPKTTVSSFYRVLKRDVLRDRHVTDTIMDSADYCHHAVHAGCRRHPHLADRGAPEGPGPNRGGLRAGSLFPPLLHLQPLHQDPRDQPHVHRQLRPLRDELRHAL